MKDCSADGLQHQLTPLETVFFASDQLNESFGFSLWSRAHHGSIKKRDVLLGKASPEFFDPSDAQG